MSINLFGALQEMWDQIGEAEEDRREMLHALEEDCLNVYRVKVASALGGGSGLRRQRMSFLALGQRRQSPVGLQRHRQ